MWACMALGVVCALLCAGCGGDSLPPLPVKEEVGKSFEVELDGGVPMKLVWIEPGEFMMGSPEGEVGRRPNEGPQHKVRITRGFYMCQTEVTQAQWESVMGSRPWNSRETLQTQHSGPDTANVAADGIMDLTLEGLYSVSKPDGKGGFKQISGSFCSMLTERTGKNFRLPTEAEWEYACRAGSTSRWSFGDDESQLDDYAWHRGNTPKGQYFPHPVAQKKPNPWGLYDMHGNAAEWCRDYNDGNYYKNSPTDDPWVSMPLPVAFGGDRMCRGGAFRLAAAYSRSAARVAKSGSPSRLMGSLAAQGFRPICQSGDGSGEDGITFFRLITELIAFGILVAIIVVIVRVIRKAIKSLVSRG